MDQFEPNFASTRNSHQAPQPVSVGTTLLLTIKHVLSGHSFQETFPATATIQDLLERTARSWPSVDSAPATCNALLFYHGREIIDKRATLAEAGICTKTTVHLA